MWRTLGGLIALVVLSACGSRVNDERSAEVAYLGLDRAVEKAMNLGMDGYNVASNANIPEQQTEGDVSGTLAVNGQVDQGASDNKELRLDLTLVDYADDQTFTDEEGDEEDWEILYATSADAPPELDLSLRDVPDGTFTGTLMGDFVMAGDLEGTVTLDLALDGDTEADPEIEGGIRRVDDTTTVTGTATSRYGTFDVALQR